MQPSITANLNWLKAMLKTSSIGFRLSLDFSLLQPIRRRCRKYKARVQTCLIAQTLKGREAQGCLSSEARALQEEDKVQCSPASGTCSAPLKLSWRLYDQGLHGVYTASRNWLCRWTDSWVRSFLAAASNSSFEHRFRNQAWIAFFNYYSAKRREVKVKPWGGQGTVAGCLQAHQRVSAWWS